MCGNGGGVYINVNNFYVIFYEANITNNAANNTNCKQISDFEHGRGGGIYYNENNNYIYIVASEISNNKAINGGGTYLSSSNKNFVIMDKFTYENMLCFETSHPYTGLFLNISLYIVIIIIIIIIIINNFHIYMLIESEITNEYIYYYFENAVKLLIIFDTQTDLSPGSTLGNN
jgi:hypothetical protein